MRRIMSVSIFLLLLSLSGTLSEAQWVRTYGGRDCREKPYSMCLTDDGGYIITGHPSGFPSRIGDSRIIKLFSNGDLDWGRIYSLWDDNLISSIQSTNDGGYIAAGGGDNGGGMGDLRVFKLYSNGDIQWQKRFRIGQRNYANHVQQTKEGGYIVAGYSDFGMGYLRVWILKLSSSGGIEWQKYFGQDKAYSIYQREDEGYYVLGASFLSCSPSSMNECCLWILSITSNGTTEWRKIYTAGDGKAPVVSSMQITGNGGLIVVGATESYGAGQLDILVLKLAANGDIQWQKTYGGASDDMANHVLQASDGKFIIGGYTESFGAGQDDIWILKLHLDGSIEWEHTFGGTNNDRGYSICQKSTGEFMVAGESDGALILLQLTSSGALDQSCSLMGNSNAVVADSGFTPEFANLIGEVTYTESFNTICIPRF